MACRRYYNACHRAGINLYANKNPRSRDDEEKIKESKRIKPNPTPAEVCYLKSVENESARIIEIKDEDSKEIGRSIDTGITDLGCSKKQISVRLCKQDGCLNVTVLGPNPCGVNGTMAEKGTQCKLMKGDIIEMVYGRLPYEVDFKDSAAMDGAIAAVNMPKTETATWETISDGDVLIYTSAGVESSEKIAGYDLDGTLITTKSGNVFAKNEHDWQIFHAKVLDKLKRLHEDGYKICIFTNQGGIGTGKISVDAFKGKILRIAEKLDVPVQVFIALGKGYYRKPAPGMWDHLRDAKNDGLNIDLKRSFYVGDAAGRPESGKGVNKRRKDHSLADRLFAANINVSFFTPEEHFLNLSPEAWNKPEFEPKLIDAETPLLLPETFKIPADSLEIIVLVGLPGSGKSHFAKQHLEPLGYKIQNADTLGNVQACIKNCTKELLAGNSCVIDNTNVDAESRKKFLALAKARNKPIPCRCLVMNTPAGQVKHNIAFRQLIDKNHAVINAFVLNGMKKRYKEPTLQEGFAEIAKVNFKPSFSSTQEEELYNLYLVDK